MAGLLGLGAPGAARAQEYYTVRQLLAEQFKSSTRVSYVRVRPSGEQRTRIERKLGRDLAKADYTVYVAQTGERIDGYALFDDELGQHEPITFATFFDAQGKVTRVEVVAYREPYGDGVRAERFRRQFVGKNAQSGFTPQADIDAISGATISSRSLCVGVQRATLLLDETVLHGRAALAGGGTAPALRGGGADTGTAPALRGGASDSSEAPQALLTR